MDKSLIQGQKSLFTRCAPNAIIQLQDINNFATGVCAGFSDNSPPPLFSHKKCNV